MTLSISFCVRGTLPVFMRRVIKSLFRLATASGSIFEGRSFCSLSKFCVILTSYHTAFEMSRRVGGLVVILFSS